MFNVFVILHFVLLSYIHGCVSMQKNTYIHTLYIYILCVRVMLTCGLSYIDTSHYGARFENILGSRMSQLECYMFQNGEYVEVLSITNTVFFFFKVNGKKAIFTLMKEGIYKFWFYKFIKCPEISHWSKICCIRKTKHKFIWLFMLLFVLVTRETI